MAVTHKLDLIDIHLLKILQEDSRKTIREIAKELNLSTTPIFERMKKLEKNGFILKQIAVLNAEMLNLKLTAFISISVTKHAKEAIDEFVSQVIRFPEVLECHHVTGKSDFLLKVILPDISKYNEFVLNKISTVSNIANIESSFSLSVRKDTHALPLDT